MRTLVVHVPSVAALLALVAAPACSSTSEPTPTETSKAKATKVRPAWAKRHDFVSVASPSLAGAVSPKMVEGGLRFRFEDGVATLDAPLSTRGPLDPPRYASRDGAGVRLRLQGAGDAKDQRVQGTRASVRHSAGVEEIWDNDDRGLEQTFRVNAPLGSAADELRLRVLVEGATAQLQGDEVLLVTGDGARLRYGDLAVTDAKGLSLPARFVVADAEVHIVVDTRGATYPITVDPSLRSLKSPVAKISVPGGAQTFVFAGDINKDGFQDVAVGVPNAVVSLKANAGVVRIFYGSATGLPAAPSLTLEGSAENQRFGCGLAAPGDLDGDGFPELLVGSCGYNGGQVDEGRVDLYKFSAGTPLKFASVWHYEGNLAGLKVGSVVAAGDFDGDGVSDIVVGVPGATTASGAGAGSAIMFKGAKDPAAIPITPSWTFEGEQAGAGAGFAVAAAGDVDKDGFGDLLVAAPNFDMPTGAADAGRVYLFRGSNAGPSTLPSWSADGVQPGARFGTALAGRGDVNNDTYADVAIGAPDFDAPGLTDAGAVFIFHGGKDGLPKSANSTIAGRRLYLGGPGGARLGGTLSFGDINGDKHSDLLAGYARFAGGGVSSVALYLGACNGLIPDSVFRGGSKDRRNEVAIVPWFDDPDFARVVATGADVNKDGYDDMLFSSTGSLGLNSFWDQDLDGEADEFELQQDPRAPTSFDTDGDGCDDGTDAWYNGTAGDPTKFPAGCAGGSFGSAAKLVCPQLTPIYVEEGPLAGTCVPCSVDANPTCKGGFPGALASGALNACPTDTAPLCVTTGALRGSCVAACTGPASCTDALTPVCNTQSGRCIGCDGDFGAGTPAACPSAEARFCSKEGVTLGACTGSQLKPTVADGGADGGSSSGNNQVAATGPDLSGCSACAVGQSATPRQGLLAVLGWAGAALIFARRRRRS